MARLLAVSPPRPRPPSLTAARRSGVGRTLAQEAVHGIRVWGLYLGAVNYLLILLLCGLSGLDRASGGETGQRICRVGGAVR